MPLSNIEAIERKVRLLTRRPSTSQMGETIFLQYVNNYMSQDMARELQLFDLRESFFFFTDPGRDHYITSNNPNSQLFNFVDRYNGFFPPVYVSGHGAELTYSREAFYRAFPFSYETYDIGLRGDGVQTQFTGTIPGVSERNRLLQNNVMITSISDNGDGIKAFDNPDGVAQMFIAGWSGDVAAVNAGDVNYRTGEFTVNFSVPPRQGEPIEIQAEIGKTGRPFIILFYQNEFWVRPIPDKVYKIQMDAMRQPTDLAPVINNSPNVGSWWELIALGTARKILQDNGQHEEARELEPEIQRQERLALRRKVLMNAERRPATIYNPGIQTGGGYWYNTYNF